MGTRFSLVRVTTTSLRSGTCDLDSKAEKYNNKGMDPLFILFKEM